MPVDTATASRKAKQDVWKRCRTAHEGSDAVHQHDLAKLTGNAENILNVGAGWWFLPPRPKMNAKQYRAYHVLALWAGITRRTVDGLVGLLFREPPTHGLPAHLADNATGTGRTIRQVAADVTRELIVTGQCTITAGIPEGDIRPRLRVLPAESLLEVRHEASPEGYIPTLIRMMAERSEPDPEDPWVPKQVDQVVVMRADEGLPYRVETYERKQDADSDEAEKWELVDTTFGSVREQPLDKLPVVHIKIEEADDGEPTPPIVGVVDLNTDHYRLRAAQAYVLHHVLPTLVVTGSAMSTDELDKIQLGVQTVLRFSGGGKGNPVNAQFVGVGGGDLQAHEKRIEDTETLAARMGARMLMEPPKAGVEAAETLRLRHSGEGATMVQLADAVDSAMSLACHWLLKLDGIGGTSAFTVDRTAIAIDPSRITQLKEMFEAQMLPLRLVLQECQRMRLFPDDEDPKKLAEEVKADQPAPPPVIVPGAGDDPPPTEDDE